MEITERCASLLDRPRGRIPNTGVDIFGVGHRGFRLAREDLLQ